MLAHTLTVLQQVKRIAGVLVVSRDSAALSQARQYGAQTVQESGSPKLNEALTRATQVVATWNAEGVLVLPADLPLLCVEDIEGMLALGTYAPTVVIAPDRHGTGTNALLLRPPRVIKYGFGEGSCQKHQEYANEIGAELHIYQSPTLALDVDTPADLDMYREELLERDLGEPVWLGGM